MRTFLSWTVAAALIGFGFIAFGCENAGSQQAEDVNVLDFRYVEQPNGDREFTGEVQNQGNTDISIVQIEVTLFDEGGGQIGTQYIEVEDIPAEDTRPFTHPLDHSGPVSQARVNGVMTP